MLATKSGWILHGEWLAKVGFSVSLERLGKSPQNERKSQFRPFGYFIKYGKSSLDIYSNNIYGI